MQRLVRLSLAWLLVSSALIGGGGSGHAAHPDAAISTVGAGNGNIADQPSRPTPPATEALARLDSASRPQDTASGSEPFGIRPASTLPEPLGEISSKWAELQSRIVRDQLTIEACRSADELCPVAARRFLSIVELGRRNEGRAQLGAINRAVNLSIKPVSDWQQYGMDDFWSSPLATLSAEAGDCEDYAIVKYVALQEAGIAANDLRLVIVQDSKRRTLHAVVAVRREQRWWILDNRTLVMTDAEDLRHYQPLLVLDHRGARASQRLVVDTQ
jgi:predicted transglutaminase-like cysteine proteinase